MDAGFIDLIERSARVAAITLAACGLFLIFLDLGRAPEPGRLRRRLSAIWNELAAASIAEVPVLAVGAAIGSLNRFIVYWFEQSERNVVTAGAFTLVVFVAIPIASVINWLRGGSPILVFALLGCVACVILLAILSETRRYPSVPKILSPLLSVTIFLVVPSYVFFSLTDRALNISIAHGALISLLIAPLLYLVGHSLILLGAGAYAMPVPSFRASDVRRIATLFAAFLAPAYLAAFGGLLVWHVIVPELPEPSTWPVLIVVVGCTALASAASIHLAVPHRVRRLGFVGLSARLALGAAVAALSALCVTVTIDVPGGASAAMAILPLAVPAILIAIAGGALLAKLVLAIAQPIATPAAFAERPYGIAGILALILASGAGWAAAAL